MRADGQLLTAGGGDRPGLVVLGEEVMIPGELFTDGADHVLNPGRRTLTLVVQNTADRPIQVGSHYHFAETNGALQFDRDAARLALTTSIARACGLHRSLQRASSVQHKEQMAPW